MKKSTIQKFWEIYEENILLFEKIFHSIPMSEFWLDYKYDFIEDSILKLILKWTTDENIKKYMKNSLRNRMIDEHRKLKVKNLEYIEWLENHQIIYIDHDKQSLKIEEIKNLFENENIKKIIDICSRWHENKKEQEAFKSISFKLNELCDELDMTYWQIKYAIWNIRKELSKYYS